MLNDRPDGLCRQGRLICETYRNLAGQYRAQADEAAAEGRATVTMPVNEMRLLAQLLDGVGNGFADLTGTIVGPLRPEDFARPEQPISREMKELRG